MLFETYLKKLLSKECSACRRERPVRYYTTVQQLLLYAAEIGLVYISRVCVRAS